MASAAFASSATTIPDKRDASKSPIELERTYVDNEFKPEGIEDF